METQEVNNAAVEMQRRKAIIDARNNAPSADKQHRENVPKVETARSVTMHSSRMRLAEYDRQDWTANAEVGHTIDDILKPAYWAHMSAQMQPYDHVEVRAEDGSWIAELIVLEPGRNYAKMALKYKYELPSTEAIPQGAEHVVEWKGPQHRFVVIRCSDREYIRDKFQTKEEANSWMREHERTMGT